MSKNRKRSKKKRHFLVDVLPNENVTVFDMFSRFDIEMKILQRDAGRLAIDFLLPGSVRIAKGNNGER